MRAIGLALFGAVLFAAPAAAADIDARWSAYDRAMPCESASTPQDAVMNCTSLIMFIGFDLAAKNDTEPLPPLVARALYFRGVANIALEQWSKALYDFNEAIGKRPDYAEAFEKRGDVFEGTGQPDKAVADWQKAWELGDHSDALAEKLRRHGAM